MATVQIHGAEHSLTSIFSDDFLFTIPKYQRPYSWGVEQATELIDDLLASISGSHPVDELEPYFLGNVVLIKDKDKPDAEVVDGQQRLTTLTILLAALAEALPGNAGRNVRSFLLQEANLIAGTEATFRLRLRERDADFFRQYIQEPSSLDRIAALEKAQLSDARRNIQANALALRTKLKAEGDDRLQRLAMFLIQRTFLVVVSTPDLYSAYRIFSVLNERGLDLTPSDIFKARVLGNTPEAKEDEYTNIWEEWEETLGRESFADLFSHIRMLYARAKQRETIIREFDSLVFPKVPPGTGFVDNILVPYAAAFEQVVKCDYVSTNHASQVNDLLRWMSRLDNADWVPPAISWLAKHGEDEQSVLRFLTYLERLAASLFIRRIDINRRLERYGRLLRAIDSGDDVFALDSVLQLSRTEAYDTREALDGDLYLATKVRLYVLLRLDSALSSGGATYDYPTLSIEHVLPQTPEYGSIWSSTFSLTDQEMWVHRLANLVLLTRRKNSQASNYDFEDKKKLYFMGPGGTSPFVLTTQALNSSQWTPDVLTARQTVLLDKLAEVWKLRSPKAT